MPRGFLLSRHKERNKIVIESPKPRILEMILLRESPQKHFKALKGTSFGLPVSSSVKGVGDPKCSNSHVL